MSVVHAKSSHKTQCGPEKQQSGHRESAEITAVTALLTCHRHDMPQAHPSRALLLAHWFDAMATVGERRSTHVPHVPLPIFHAVAIALILAGGVDAIPDGQCGLDGMGRQRLVEQGLIAVHRRLQ